jgi:hypothetical protein
MNMIFGNNRPFINKMREPSCKITLWNHDGTCVDRQTNSYSPFVRRYYGNFDTNIANIHDCTSRFRITGGSNPLDKRSANIDVMIDNIDSTNAIGMSPLRLTGNCWYGLYKYNQLGQNIEYDSCKLKVVPALWTSMACIALLSQVVGTAATLVCACVVPFCLYEALQLPAEKYASDVERGEIDPGNDRAESIAQYLTAAISHGVYLFRGCPLYLGMASVCAAISNTAKLLWNYFKR